MTAINDTFILQAVVVFCRFGGCLLVLPGLSSARIPVSVRLYFALALSAAMVPNISLGDDVEVEPGRRDVGLLLSLVLTETSIGLTFGLVARFLVAAVRFAGTAITNFIGLGTLPGLVADDIEPNPALSSFLAMTATLIIFLTDLHLQTLAALVATYDVLPAGALLSAGEALRMLVNATTVSFLLALKISAPFLVYGIVVNFLFGIASRFTPQIPAYFVSIPFLILGGLLLLFFALPLILDAFSTYYDALVLQGA